MQEAVVTVPRDLIVQAIDLVVFLEGRGADRRVETLLEVASLDADGRLPLEAARLPDPAHRLTERTDMTPMPLLRRLLRDTVMRLGRRLPLAVIVADAANAAGSGMPWEAPLQRILESIEGPVAKVVAVVIIIVTGLSLAFGDMGGGFRRLIQIVFGLSIAFAATSFFLSFFSFAGGALIN